MTTTKTTWFHGWQCLPLVTFLPACLIASAQALQCPAEISAASVKIEPVPKDWVAWTPARLKLSSAGLMAGAPQTMTDLKPYSISNNKRQSVAVWEFDSAVYPDGVWLSCSYGAQGEVMLSRKIETSYRKCTVTSMTAAKALATDIEVACEK